MWTTNSDDPVDCCENKIEMMKPVSSPMKWCVRMSQPDSPTARAKEPSLSFIITITILSTNIYLWHTMPSTAHVKFLLKGVNSISFHSFFFHPPRPPLYATVFSAQRFLPFHFESFILIDWLVDALPRPVRWPLQKLCTVFSPYFLFISANHNCQCAKHIYSFI